MADEEVVRSGVLQGEEVHDEVLRNNSSKGVGRNQKGYDNDDVEIDNEAGKSREKRKRDSKERKKERREVKDYGCKDKDWSMRRRKEDTLSRDVEKHGSREMVRERVSSSSDKKKEFWGDFVMDSEALEFDEEKARDKIRAKDYTRSKHREEREHEHAKYKSRKHEKGKVTYQKRERNFDMEQEESRDHGKDRGREGRYEGKERCKEKCVDPSSDRSIDREHDQNRDQMKDKALEGGNEKVVEDRVLHWDHEHGKEREKGYGHHRDQDEDSETNKDKAHEKSKIRDKDHTQEIDKGSESDNIIPDEIIHETAVGKGLSGALKLLKDRGTLKESIDWGGRNMDKKKSKLVGIYANDGTKEVRIERTDEFGRILTPKESFRILSHKFHGKGPGKMKLEKRMKQYHEDLKAKHMKASDTPLLAMEKMREAQARLQSPYIVLSGNVKPGQTSDPRSGFATVERDNPGSLTPMLGDKKVEHFLGIRNKHESGSMGPPPAKKPKL